MAIFNGLMTLLLMAVFVGIVVWAWRAERKKSFDQAARVPLEEDRP